MSQWNHSICDACWEKEEGDRKPKRAPEEVTRKETCCWCGGETKSGIYYVHRPSGLLCKGKCTIPGYK